MRCAFDVIIYFSLRFQQLNNLVGWSKILPIFRILPEVSKLFIYEMLNIILKLSHKWPINFHNLWKLGW